MKQLTRRLDLSKEALRLVRASFAEPVILSDSGDAKDLPAQIRLFKLGKNETTKGTFWLADWSIDACLHAENERNVDYPINKNHSYAEAYGWFNLARGEGGDLYASKPRSKPEMTGIWWLDTPAVEEVKKGQWRYTSAEFWVVPEWIEDSEGYYVDVHWWIVEIVGLALTNYPATHNAQPLILSDINKEAPYFAQLSARNPLEFKTMDELAKKEAAAKAQQASNNNPAPAPAPVQTSTPAPVVATQPTQEQLMSVWSLACELTKQSTAPAVCGVLRAHASSHENLMGLSTELAALKTQKAAEEVAQKETKETSAKNEKLERAKAAVNKAIDEFKVPRANYEKTLSLAGENGEKVEELEAHLSALHPILSPGPVLSQASNTRSNGVALAVNPTAAPVVLSDDEKRIAKSIGLTEEEFAAEKRKG